MSMRRDAGFRFTGSVDMPDTPAGHPFLQNLYPASLSYPGENHITPVVSLHHAMMTFTPRSVIRCLKVSGIPESVMR